MKRMYLIVSLAAAVLLVSSMAFADGVPELRGTWRGPSLVQTVNKSLESKGAFVINKQTGPLFAGYKLWFDKDNVLQRETFVGVYDNGEIRLAEGNKGYGFGYLTGKQTLVINYLENGALAKAILYDLERIYFQTGFVEIDKDGSKTLIRAEIKTHYPLNAERIIKEADTNKDGKLTKKEWDAWQKANGQGAK